MKEHKYEVLLASVIAARATSFIFSKMILEYIDTFNLLAIRCLLAFAILAVLFFKRLRDMPFKTVISGVIVGILFFLVMSAELTALKEASSSTVSLLENCAIIFVPLLEAILLWRLPSGRIMISALAAFLGVACLTLAQGGLTGGVFWGLLSAVLYAIAIIVTAKVSQGSGEPLCIGIIQVGTMGVLALSASFLFETPALPAGSRQWIMIGILAVVCTCFGFTLQPMAQSRISAERAGIFCAISPAIATLLGVAVLHENIGFLGIAGLILILSSIVIA